MSSRSQRDAIYRQILLLEQKLMTRPQLPAQKAAILETVTRLVAGEADIWLDEALWEQPCQWKKGHTDAAEVPSAAMVNVSGATPSADSSMSVTLPLSIQTPGGIITLGALEVRRPNGPPFDRRALNLLNELATHVSTALYAARRAAFVEHCARYLELAQQISAQVAESTSLKELAHHIADLLLRALGCDHVAIFALHPDRDSLSLVGSADKAVQPGLLAAHQVQLGEGLIGRVAQLGTELVANGTGREYMLPAAGSEIALPLRIGDRLIGVLDVQSEHSHAFDEASLSLLRALANDVAMVIEQARLQNFLEQRTGQLSAIAEVSRAITSILDIERLLEGVVRLIHERFAYPYVCLFTIDYARRQIVYRAGIGPVPQLPRAGELAFSLDGAGIVPWVARHGNTVLANDLLEEERTPGFDPVPTRTRAELAIPLVFGEKVLGVLDVRSEQPGAFNEEDRRLLETLADSIAAAIRNASLYRSEQWRRQVADSLREMAGYLLADVSLERKFDAILAGLERILPFDAAAIWLLNNDSLCLSAVHGYTAEMCLIDSPGSDSLPGQALSAGQPIIRTPDSPPEPLGMVLGFPPDYSAIAAPMLAGERCLGVLTLVHRTSGRYGAESRLITAAFASYAAIAIENTRLYQEAQELARISTVMLQVAEATNSLTTLDQVLDTVTRLLPPLVGVERCAILLWEEHAEKFVPAAAYGLNPLQDENFFTWAVTPAHQPVFEELRQHKAPVFIYDTVSDSRLPDLTIWDLGFESALLLPLLSQDNVIGAMLVDYQGDWFRPEGPGIALYDERLAIIQGIAMQTATAIENARLREAQQEEAYVSTALLQVAQSVANQNTLSDVLETIARITPILAGGKGCAIFLWDIERSAFRLASAYGFGPLREWSGNLASSGQQYAPGEFPLLDFVREQLVPATCQVSDANIAVPPELARLLEKEHAGLLALPLALQGNLLGAMLIMEQAGSPHPLGRGKEARRMEIIAGIAHQTALAIQGELLRRGMAERERLELELQLAHEIQQAFMPAQSPLLVGWELAFSWRAARQVAGDFYDFFELPGGKLGLVIADVADKGMPAALFMALTRTLIRAAALEESTPASTLARVNDLLVPDAQSGMFVTAVYATVSLETGELVYANAGHNLPLLLKTRTGELEQLRKGGMALGVLEGIRIQEHRILLNPGDYVIFYTDGITEAFTSEGGEPVESYGEERLWATVKAANGSSAQAMLEAIESSVDAFVGDTPPSDDRTIMILRRNGGAENQG